MIVCDYLLSGACFKAKAESNSAAGTRVASKSGRAGFSLERMAVSDA